jgi:putative SbcD/Mre11-related phosphoesterase
MKRLYKEELERLFAKLEIKKVILAGDIKHEFGTISREEWFDVQELVATIRKHSAEVEAVGGNHDVLVKPILERLGIVLQKALVVTNGVNKILITHGDATLEQLDEKGQLPQLEGVTTLIIGHEHPAMRITDGLRNETVKCFLVGKHHYKKQLNLIVMPSWNPLAFGTDIIRERPLGPLLNGFTDFSAFAIVERKVLAFGFVEKLQRLSIMK